jgi:rubredoxin
MKHTLYSVLLIFLIAVNVATSFAPSSRTKNTIMTQTSSINTKLHLFGFGEPKDDGSPGDYVCKDCGYVFTKGPEAWAKLDDKYRCPPCGAPKFRFKKVPKGSASGKVEVKKNWFGK